LRTGLFVTTADLSPEMRPLPPLVAVAATTRIGGAPAAVKRLFAETALADGLARAAAHAGCAPDRLDEADAITAMAPPVDATAAVAAVSAAPTPVVGLPPATSLGPRLLPRDESREPTEGPAPDASAEEAVPVAAPGSSSSSVPSPSLEGATAPIDRAALGNAIAAAAASAAGCVSDPSAPSSVRIEAVFAPSGRTTRTSVVGGPFAGTETGTCIARALREMQVPAFDGEAVVVTKTVRLR
jgi:hypothetical protein